MAIWYSWVLCVFSYNSYMTIISSWEDLGTFKNLLSFFYFLISMYSYYLKYCVYTNIGICIVLNTSIKWTRFSLDLQKHILSFGTTWELWNDLLEFRSIYYEPRKSPVAYQGAEWFLWDYRDRRMLETLYLSTYSMLDCHILEIYMVLWSTLLALALHSSTLSFTFSPRP